VRSSGPDLLSADPDWKASQAEEVRSSCVSDEHDVFVAVADGRPVGFAAAAAFALAQRRPDVLNTTHARLVGPGFLLAPTARDGSLRDE
jgi:hypothetical protein